MNRLFKSLLLLIALVPSFASATGYGPWSFGMTKADVRAIAEANPYYEFRNGDIGSQNGTFEGERAPISFYFQGERLVRVMVVAYAGTDYEKAKRAWLKAHAHIQQNFGGTEVPSKGKGPSDAKAAAEALDESGLRTGANAKIQMGATPMPKDRTVWSTVNIVPNVGYWVAVNYAEP